jgi:iron(III) transport system substrate-binding protein
MLKASAVLAAGTVFPEPLKAAAPEPTMVSPAIIEAAGKEGMVAFYTAMEIPVAENLGKASRPSIPELPST